MTVDLGQGAELHVGGATVGIFLSQAKLREMTEEREQLRRELDEARRELALVKAERESLASTLIAEIERNGVDFGQVIREVEGIVQGTKTGEGRGA